MNNLTITVIEGEPKPEDLKALSAGLLSHHASKGHPRTWQNSAYS